VVAPGAAPHGACNAQSIKRDNASLRRRPPKKRSVTDCTFHREQPVLVTVNQRGCVKVGALPDEVVVFRQLSTAGHW